MNPALPVRRWDYLERKGWMNVVMPEIGDDVKEATVSFWHVDKGQEIKKDDDLVEMVTEKATFNVPAPISGVVKETMFEEGQVVKVGDTIAIIEPA